MYSILPASSSPPLLSSEPKPRLPQWGTPKTPCTAYCCHPSPLKGPANTQLPFRQLLPSSPSEEERGLREGGGGGRHELPRNTYICTHILHLYTPPPPHTPHPHTCTPPLSRSLTVRSTSTPFRCKKSREEGGRGEVGGWGRGRGGIHVYFCFWFGFFCVLSLRRKIQPVI